MLNPVTFLLKQTKIRKVNRVLRSIYPYLLTGLNDVQEPIDQSPRARLSAWGVRITVQEIPLPEYSRYPRDDFHVRNRMPEYPQHSRAFGANYLKDLGTREMLIGTYRKPRIEEERSTCGLVIKSYRGYCRISTSRIPHHPYNRPMSSYWAKDDEE